MKNIILLGGRVGSGKDLVAKYLVNSHGYTRLAFADSLKEYTSLRYSISKDLMMSHLGKKVTIQFGNRSLSIRDLLIKVSSDQRKKYPDYFVDIIKDKVGNLPIGSNIVISDFRYPNEFYNLYYQTGNKLTTVNVIRNHTDPSDPSETELSAFRFDYTLLNNSSIQSLYKKIKLLRPRIENQRYIF